MRLVAVLVIPPALYFGAAEVAMRWPVNGEVDPLEGSIDIYLRTNGPHVDIWVPAHWTAADGSRERWADILPSDYQTRIDGYLSIGWGDRAFYTQVPTWDDLTIPVALKGALLPTESTMRVTSWGGPPFESGSVHLLAVDEEGYRGLCEYIRASIELGPDGRMQAIEFKGSEKAIEDRCFKARGSYHMLQTCNSWTNGALKAAGKKAAVWAPLPRGVLHQLPKNNGLRTPK